MGQQVRWHIQRRSGLAALILCLPIVFASCGQNLRSGSAGAARTQVNTALQQAQASGVPLGTVAALRRQRDAIDGQRGWFGISETTAAGRYQTLVASIQQAESSAISQMKGEAQQDLAMLTTSIQQNQAAMFQSQSSTLQGRFIQAKLPREYTAIVSDAQAALDAVHAMTPARDGLTHLNSLISQMHAAGLPTTLAQAQYSEAQQAFASAQTAAEFDQVTAMVQGDLVTLANDQAQAIPYLAQGLVKTLHDQITLLQSYGENVTSYQPGYIQAQAELPAVATLAHYTTFATSVQGQLTALALPLARGQARHDIAQLTTLLDYTHQHNIMSYEYMGDWGLPDVQQRFDWAGSAADFRAADDEAAMLVENLRAMITNVSDGTPYNQPHATDLALLGYYHATTGKAIVISLREQTLRAYDNGQLAMSMYITSGRPELPSPPGYTTVTERLSPTVFKSDAPKNSPFYYNPTPINYALLYHDGGYFIHDAWWRLQFGPGSNLPHYDPEAFNGGSHGCVNVALQPMAQLYAWTPVGTPVILY